jgi:hypothetical protein
MNISPALADKVMSAAKQAAIEKRLPAVNIAICDAACS